MSDANVYSPATRPLFNPAPVRGQHTFRRPAGPGPDLPRFSYPGLVDTVDESPEWAIDGDMHLIEAFVCMPVTGEGLHIWIKVNGSLEQAIALGSAAWWPYPIDLNVNLNDRVTILLDDVGDGLCERLSIVLRPFTSFSPPPPV